MQASSTSPPTPDGAATAVLAGLPRRRAHPCSCGRSSPPRRNPRSVQPLSPLPKGPPCISPGSHRHLRRPAVGLSLAVAPPKSATTEQGRPPARRSPSTPPTPPANCRRPRAPGPATFVTNSGTAATGVLRLQQDNRVLGGRKTSHPACNANWWSSSTNRLLHGGLQARHGRRRHPRRLLRHGRGFPRPRTPVSPMRPPRLPRPTSSGQAGGWSPPLRLSWHRSKPVTSPPPRPSIRRRGPPGACIEPVARIVPG